MASANYLRTSVRSASRGGDRYLVRKELSLSSFCGFHFRHSLLFLVSLRSRHVSDK